MAISGSQPGLVPNLLHRSPDGKLLLSEKGGHLTRSVTPRFVALVADDFIQLRWGEWVSGTCSRITAFAVAPVDADLLVRFTGAAAAPGPAMLQEKVNGSDAWKCFIDPKESDLPKQMRVEYDVPSTILPFEFVFSTDEEIARELSDTAVIQLKPGWLGGMDVEGYYGVSIGTPDYSNTTLEEKDTFWPDNIFSEAERGNTQGRGLLSSSWADGGSHWGESMYKDPDTGEDLAGDRVGVEYHNAGLVASEFVKRLGMYAEKLGGRYFGDYHPALGIEGAVAEQYMFVSQTDLDKYAEEAEAATEAINEHLGTSYGKSDYQYFLDILNAESQGCVKVDGGVMWSVVKSGYVNGGGIGNMVLYTAENFCDDKSPCRASGPGNWTYTCGTRYTGTHTVAMKEGTYTKVPMACRRYEYVTVNGLRKVGCTSVSRQMVGTKLAQQLAPENSKGEDQVGELVDEIRKRLEKEVSKYGTQCSLLDKLDFYPVGLQDATYQPVGSNCEGPLMTPPTCVRYLQGRVPLEYHTAKQLRALIDMPDPEPDAKPTEEGGERVPVTGTGEWFTWPPRGGMRVFDSFANAVDDSGRPADEGLALTKAWSWDKFGDNLFRNRLFDEIEEPGESA